MAVREFPSRPKKKVEKTEMKLWKHLIVNLILCCIVGMQSPILAKAQEADTDYQEILSEYEKNSVEYEQASLWVQNQIIMYHEYEAQEKMYEEQLTESLTEQGRINTKKYHEQSILNKNLLKVYVEHEEEVLQMKQREAQYDFLKEALKIPVLSRYVSLKEAVYKEYKQAYQNTVAKRKQGYATKKQVTEAKLAMDNAKEEAESARENYYNLLDSIKETIGCETLPSVILKEKKKIKTLVEYKRGYEEAPTALILEANCASYREYEEAIRETLPEEENLIKKAENQTKQSEKQKEAYKKNSIQKIKTQIAAFRHQTAMYQIYTKKIAEGKKQLKTKKLLYQHGKINKLEVLKQISTNEEMEYKRLESLYEINLSYYYLEYKINQ